MSQGQGEEVRREVSALEKKEGRSYKQRREILFFKLENEKDLPMKGWEVGEGLFLWC